MPVIKGTNSISPIYKGVDKIDKIYKGIYLVYQSYVYNPVIALLERNIVNVDVELTSNITTIGDFSFYDCKELSNIIIPSSVTSVGNNAFNGCLSLTQMTILATTPPTLANVSSISSNTTTIYVPQSSVSSYQTASVWVDLTTRATNPVTFVGI